MPFFAKTNADIPIIFFWIIEDDQNVLYPHLTVCVFLTVSEIPIVSIEIESPCIFLNHKIVSQLIPVLTIQPKTIY